MATYMQIQGWVKRHYMFVPATSWIAHVKELNRLPVEHKGEPRMVLYDKDGNSRTELFLGTDGEPILKLSDQNGKIRAVLSLVLDGKPGLTFADENDNIRALFSLASDGEPFLLLYDQNEKLIWNAP